MTKGSKPRKKLEPAAVKDYYWLRWPEPYTYKESENGKAQID